MWFYQKQSFPISELSHKLIKDFRVVAWCCNYQIGAYGPPKLFNSQVLLNLLEEYLYLRAVAEQSSNLRYRCFEIVGQSIWLLIRGSSAWGHKVGLWLSDPAGGARKGAEMVSKLTVLTRMDEVTCRRSSSRGICPG